MKKEKPRLLYINHQYRVSSSAGEINARLRKKAMEEAGLEVLLYQCQSSRFKFLPHFWDILKLLPRIRVVCIRIDGTSILEKFSLLKLFKPELKIIWEIHGRVEEVFFNQRSLVDRLVIFKKNLKRKFFAFLVDGVICDSRERQDYVFKNLKINRVFLIPSFVDKKKPSSKPILASVLNRQGFFKVVWGGGGGFRWQALDLIEKVAKKTFLEDSGILFLVIGDNKWHQFTFFKNIVSLDSLPHQDYLGLLNQADLCLALYYQQDNFNFTFDYSPLKLYEYMALSKPVIATDVGQIGRVIKNGENGFLTDNDPEKIVRQILFLKKHPYLRKKIGKNAEETISKNYSLKRAVLKYQKAFFSLGLLS